MQKGNMVVWGGLTNSWEKKRNKSQRRKGKIYPSECIVPKNSKERKESLSKWTMQKKKKKKKKKKQKKKKKKKKKRGKTIELERVEISSRKLEIPREHFM